MEHIMEKNIFLKMFVIIGIFLCPMDTKAQKKMVDASTQTPTKTLCFRFNSPKKSLQITIDRTIIKYLPEWTYIHNLACTKNASIITFNWNKCLPEHIIEAFFNTVTTYYRIKKIHAMTPLQNFKHVWKKAFQDTVKKKIINLKDILELCELTSQVKATFLDKSLAKMFAENIPLESLENQLTELSSLQNIDNTLKCIIEENIKHTPRTLKDIVRIKPLQRQKVFKEERGTLIIALNEKTIGYQLSNIEDLPKILSQNFGDDIFNKPLALDLSNNKIKNLKPLEQLKNIRWLKLNNNKIKDIKPLENLTNLIDLNLNNNKIKNLASLKNSILYLQLDNNLIENLTPLKNLVNLERLSIANNKIIHIKSLKKLTNLKQLNLKNNQVQNIKPLTNLHQLQILFIDRNQTTDFTPLENLKNLKQLAIGNNNIKDLSFLRKMTKLERLNIKKTLINDIRILTNHTSLSFLYIAGCSFKEMNTIFSLKNLVSLMVDKKQFEKIKHLLAFLPKLKALAIHTKSTEKLPPKFNHGGVSFEKEKIVTQKVSNNTDHSSIVVYKKISSQLEQRS